eukprot:m51a1_g13725 hypothetical protein (270) ;mRNA; f:116535-117399
MAALPVSLLALRQQSSLPVVTTAQQKQRIALLKPALLFDTYALRREDCTFVTNDQVAAAAQQTRNYEALVHQIEVNTAAMQTMKARMDQFQEELAAVHKTNAALSERNAALDQRNAALDCELGRVKTSVAALHRAVVHGAWELSHHLHAIEVSARRDPGEGSSDKDEEARRQRDFARQVAEKLEALRTRVVEKMPPATQSPRSPSPALTPTGGEPSVHWCRRCLALSTEVEAASEGSGRCGRCLRAWYCSTTCQKADWSVHKADCQPDG